MNSLDFLKQAQLADNLGYFRLADQLYKKASRTITASAFDRALFEALEKAGIKASERASLEAIEVALSDSIMAVIRTGESAEFRLFAKEAGLSDETILELMLNAFKNKRFSPTTLERMAKILENKLNSEDSIFNRMLKDVPPKDVPPKDVPPKDVPPKDVPPIETPLDVPPSKFDKLKGNLKQTINKMMSLSSNKKKLAGLGILVLGSAAAGWYFVNANGDPVSDEEVEAALNGADPYSNMYEDRMKAGQQQRQNEAAQKFVDENKSKYTSQRAFYDAALGAGDKNFANDVIAIVKKDTPELPREPTKSGEKESSSYLNKTPYSGS
jgi:hypothetical protein